MGDQGPFYNYSLPGTNGLQGVKYAKLTQREGAGRLGLATGAGVSYQIRKLHRQMAS